MSKFTPGPWKATECMSHGTSVKAIASVAWCGTSTSVGKGGNQHIDSAEAYANAMLIADAPALLDALEKSFKALDAIADEMTVGERFTNAGQYLVDALEPARALIAKHRGYS